MALPLSGPISMSQINTELSLPATTLISLNQSTARSLAGVPAGMISLSNFYGKSNVSNVGFNASRTTPTPGSVNPSICLYTNLSTQTGSPITAINRTGAQRTNTTDATFYLGGITSNSITVANGGVGKFVYSTQTGTSTVGFIPVAIVGSGAIGGTENEGYIAGGPRYSGGPSGPNLTTNKYIYATNTGSTFPFTFTPNATTQIRNVYNPTYMWFIIGPLAPTNVRTFPYATETWSSPFAVPTITATNGQGATANNTLTGTSYWFGGAPPFPVSNPFRYKFSQPTQTVTTLPSVPSPILGEYAGWVNSTTFSLGCYTGPMPGTTVNRQLLNFSTDTVTAAPSLPTPFAGGNGGQPSGIML